MNRLIGYQKKNRNRKKTIIIIIIIRDSSESETDLLAEKRTCFFLPLSSAHGRVNVPGHIRSLALLLSTVLLLMIGRAAASAPPPPSLPPSRVVYAFDPRGTSRFTFLAFRPQSLLGYLLSPPLSLSLHNQSSARGAATHRTVPREEDEPRLTRVGKQWNYLDLYVSPRGREEGFVMMRA